MLVCAFVSGSVSIYWPSPMCRGFASIGFEKPPINADILCCYYCLLNDACFYFRFEVLSTGSNHTHSLSQMSILVLCQSCRLNAHNLSATTLKEIEI